MRAPTFRNKDICGMLNDKRKRQSWRRRMKSYIRENWGFTESRDLRATVIVDAMLKHARATKRS